MRAPPANRPRLGPVLMLVGAGAVILGIAREEGVLFDFEPCAFVCAGVLVLVAGLFVHGLARLEE